MTNGEIVALLIDILVGELGVSAAREHIHEGSELQADLALDSVALLQLVTAAERRLERELPETAWKPSTFRTVGTLARAIAAPDNAGQS